MAGRSSRTLARVPPLPAAVDLGSEEGVRAAYAEHGAELYRFALQRLGDEGQAQDAVQETFVRAWRAADRFDPTLASLRTWLYAIARNVVIDLSRRRAARREVAAAPEQIPEPAEGGRPFDEATMTTWVIEEALRRISPEQRTALIETYLRGRRYAEVAAELAVPAATLRSRVFYGLKALRLVLDEMGVAL